MGVFATTVPQPFDVISSSPTEALITAHDSEAGIKKYNSAGTYVSDFVAPGTFTTIQQINKVKNGNYIISVDASYSTPNHPVGIYELDAASGNIVNFWALSSSSGVTGCIQLENGNILLSMNGGAYVLDIATGTTTLVAAGSFGYFSKGTLPGSLAVQENSVQVKQLEVVPNPTSGIFKIEAAHKILEAQIYSISGNLVKSVVKDFDNIDLSSVEKGIYIIKVRTTKENVALKLIKK